MIKKILIFQIGSIGDVLVELPIFTAIRKRYPEAEITLLNCAGAANISNCAPQLLENTKLIDKYLYYTRHTNKIIRLGVFLQQWLKLRHQKFDLMFYAVRDINIAQRASRDRKFFRSVGIRTLVGFDNFYHFPKKEPGMPMPKVLSVTEQIARRLDLSINLEDRIMPLTSEERERAHQTVASWSLAPGCIPIAIGIGGKKRTCQWPLENYESVLLRLMAARDVLPVFFGDRHDQEKIERFLKILPRAVNASTYGLSLRESIALLGRCRFYFGNDCGSIHMATAAGIPCVGIYSAHSYNGMWHPLGEAHTVFRTAPDCECCLKLECDDFPARCLSAIIPEPVYQAVLRQVDEAR